MVDLSGAGSRLGAYKPEATPPLAEIVRRRDQRRRRRSRRVVGTSGLVGVISLVIALLVAKAPFHTETVTTEGVAGGASSSIPPPVASANAAQLAGGQWSALPRAPIVPRLQASVVWTGQQMIVWGGASGIDGSHLHGDGARFDPSSSQWQPLAQSPLSPRSGQAAAWTGSEMIIWGGYDHVSSAAFHVTNDGAAYDPATNTWRLLPPAPITARAHTLALWTGGRMVLLGGRPAVLGAADQSYGDGAAFDPGGGTWQHIDAPSAPPGHGLSWQTAAATDREIFAWSEWSTTQQLGANTSRMSGGTDLFAYEPSAGRWRQIQPSAGALARSAQALWTGRFLLVRGDTHSCGGCKRPYTPTATALFDPTQNTWTPVPPDPLGASDLLSVWTGAAMLSFNPHGLYGNTVPGDSSAYEPSTGQWTLLPRAPFGCGQSQPPLWTGTQVLLYCPDGDATHDGIALTRQS